MNINNQASISYNNNQTAISNMATVQYVTGISMTKSSTISSYNNDSTFRYEITMSNPTNIAFNNLSLLDDLGAYTFSESLRFPLSYVTNSAILTIYQNGTTLNEILTINEESNGILFNFSIPANSVGVISYLVDTTIYAPLDIGSSITNTATLSGGGFETSIVDSLTLPVSNDVDINISKFATITSNDIITYTFVVSNYGNSPITTSNFLSINDTLQPSLTNVIVYGNGILWTNGIEYDYSPTLALFRTNSGTITLDSATFTQQSFGNYLITPSTFIITLTGQINN